MRIKHIAEYLALRVGLGAFQVLPHRLALGLASGIATVMHKMLHWRRDLARARIRQVLGPDVADTDINRYAWESFRNLAWNTVEVARIDQLSAQWFREHYDADDVVKQIRDRLDEGQGALLVIVHSGNWDLATVHLAKLGLPLCVIARNQKNPLTNRYLNRSRKIGGGDVVDRDDPKLVRELLARLNEGKGVGVLIDLRSRTKVPPSRYLGHDAYLGNGLGLLAAKSGAPVIPIHLERTGPMSHRWVAGKEIRVTDPKDKAKRNEVLQHCLDELSPHVIDNPGNYFWYNKRWVLEPFD